MFLVPKIQEQWVPTLPELWLCGDCDHIAILTPLKHLEEWTFYCKEKNRVIQLESDICAEFMRKLQKSEKIP